ncbi:MAG: FecR family protein [Acidobacteriota bacterium]|nr:FecR family protein [Acidobacteriota bacterium]
MRDPDHDRSSPRARNEDRVGTLIRIAGPRPAVPDDREQRVKAAVRDHWRATTRSRTRRTRAIVTLAAAALVILAVGLGILNRSEWMGSSSPAVVERVSGTARARSEAASEGDAFGTVRAGDALPAGTELATEADGRVAIRMASRHSIRLAAGSRVTILSDRSLALDEGTVYVDSGGPLGASAGSVTISTPFGVVRDVGTQYEVSVSDTSLRLRVREGSVSLSGDTASLSVEAGTEFEVDSLGQTRERRIAAFDPEWTWISRITPMIELDGRTVTEFLGWASREGGWRVEFVGDGLEQIAGDITLSGSLDGLTVQDALTAVLPTCRMQHRVEGAVLFVEPMAEGSR